MFNIFNPTDLCIGVHIYLDWWNLWPDPTYKTRTGEFYINYGALKVHQDRYKELFEYKYKCKKWYR